MSSTDDRVKQFTEFRQRMNQRILDEPNQVVRRFFALDTQTYQAGALDVKTKELMGLTASMVLRSSSTAAWQLRQMRNWPWCISPGWLQPTKALSEEIRCTRPCSRRKSRALRTATVPGVAGRPSKAMADSLSSGVEVVRQPTPYGYGTVARVGVRASRCCGGSAAAGVRTSCGDLSQYRAGSGA